eukprot:ctg_2636.g586
MGCVGRPSSSIGPTTREAMKRAGPPACLSARMRCTMRRSRASLGRSAFGRDRRDGVEVHFVSECEEGALRKPNAFHPFPVPCGRQDPARPRPGDGDGNESVRGIDAIEPAQLLASRSAVVRRDGGRLGGVLTAKIQVGPSEIQVGGEGGGDRRTEGERWCERNGRGSAAEEHRDKNRTSRRFRVALLQRVRLDLQHGAAALLQPLHVRLHLLQLCVQC